MKHVGAALVAALAMCPPVPTVGQDLRVPLEVDVSFRAIDGTAMATLDPARPFRIELTYRSGDGGTLPSELEPRGWLRQVDRNSLACEDAARQLRLARHVLPRTTIDLSKPLLGVGSEDGSFTVVDPALNLASANVIAAARFPVPPDAIEADPVHGRFLATFGGEGVVRAVDMITGEVSVVADGLSDPSMVLAAQDASVWIFERGASRLLRHDASGARVMAEGVSAVAATADRSQMVAVTAGAVLTFMPGMAGPRSEPIEHVSAALPLGHHGPSRLAAVSGSTLILMGQERRVIDLPFVPDSLAADAHGRWLAAFARNTDSPVAIVDVGGHTVRQLVSSNSPVTEVAFGHDVGFVMSADQAMIRAVDFSRDRGGPFPVRRLTFGAPAKAPVLHDGLIAPMGDGHSVVAVHRESYTGFILHPVSAKTDMPPMSPVRLRGGVPREIAPMARGFRAEGGGRFSTWARVESAADYELVLVNGLDFSARCVRLPAPDADLSGRREPGRMMMVTQDGVGRLRLVDSAGEPVRSTEVRLLVAGLRTPHRDGLVLRTDPNGDLRLSDVPELPRPYAISARTATGQTFRIFVVQQR